DVDNTLFDWMTMWHSAFSPMLAEIEKISGIPRQCLEPEIRTIFQAHGTVEYAFLIEEMQSLRTVDVSTAKAVRARFDPAISAYREAVQKTLRPYGGVIDTLRTIRQQGCQTVAYTESLRYPTTERFKELGFDGLFDYLYSPGDFALPHDR